MSLEEYEAVATKLGTPVNAFLTSSDFSEVAPENVTVPEAMPYSGGQVSIMISMVSLVGVMILLTFVL